MATKRRIWFPGCVYHITARGNNRANIFKEKIDFYMYFKIMNECIAYYNDIKYDYNYETLCYCLMTNHVHLLIKANNKEVSHLIRKLNSTYAKYFNNKYEAVGHLYQDRYYSEIVKDDKQILEASRYIHLNPVRANIVELPEHYTYSSYKMYIGRECENIINSENLLWYFNKDRNKYKQFVEQGIK